jgi:hypothetical protein
MNPRKLVKSLGVPRAAFHLSLSIAALLGMFALSPQARATVIMDSSLQLQSLVITPASGSATLSLQGGSFGFVANESREVAFTPCPFGVTGASLNCSVDVNAPTASVSAHVDTGGSVLGGVFTNLHGSLTISGASGPVQVDFHAVFPYLQSLQSDIDIAESRLSLDLFVDGQSFQNVSLYDLKRGQFVFDSGVWDVHSVLTLSPDVPYNFNMTISDSFRANPEPPTAWLFLGFIAVLLLSRYHSARHARLAAIQHSKF